MMPEDYLRRYVESLQPMTVAAPADDWQALLLEPAYYYPPNLELGSSLDALNRTDLLEILQQVLSTEYPQQHLSRNTVIEFLEALRRLKDERAWQQIEIERLAAVLTQCQADSDRMTAELIEHRSELQRLAAELERYRGEAAVFCNEAATLRANLTDLRASTSWKVTKPLRWFGRIIKATQAPDA